MKFFLIKKENKPIESVDDTQEVANIGSKNCYTRHAWKKFNKIIDKNEIEKYLIMSDRGKEYNFEEFLDLIKDKHLIQENGW